MSMKEKRNSPKYTTALIPHGNGKLVDYTDDSGNSFRYAQVNTRAVIDCPFRSAGCEAVCYATKGNHVFKSVKASRSRSYEETRREDFGEAIAYTIRTEKETARFRNSTMIVRIHESGDFYSVQYLRKWLKAWRELEQDDGVQFTFYTKSFPFFLMLTDEEADDLNRMISSGKIAMNLSMDDTTSPEQRIAYLKMLVRYPKANTYRCTETPETEKHDNVCDCENCAKCGTCNKGTGTVTVVKIHSASNADMETYRKNAK